MRTSVLGSGNWHAALKSEQEFQRRQAPDNVTHFAHPQQPLFPKKHQAEDTGQRETRVCKDAERDVQGEDDAMGFCRRSGMLGR